MLYALFTNNFGFLMKTSINETALYQLKTTMCRPGVICEFLRVKACIMALLCLLFHTFPQLSVME